MLITDNVYVESCVFDCKRKKYNSVPGGSRDVMVVMEVSNLMQEVETRKSTSCRRSDLFLKH